MVRSSFVKRYLFYAGAIVCGFHETAEGPICLPKMLMCGKVTQTLTDHCSTIAKIEQQLACCNIVIKNGFPIVTSEYGELLSAEYNIILELQEKEEPFGKKKR